MVDTTVASSSEGGTHAPKARRAMDLHIGRRLKHRRIFMGLSQAEVANEVGVAFQQIQKYEAGINGLSTARLWTIANVLHCSVAYFYEGIIDGSSPAPPEGAQTIRTRDEPVRLIRAFYEIKDPVTRARILELAKALGSGGKTQNNV